MAILGYALEYELIPLWAHIHAFNGRNFFVSGKLRYKPKYAPDIFLRVDYGCYNVFILRLLRYL